MSPDRAHYVDALRRAIATPAGSREHNREAIGRRLADGEIVEDEDDDDARAAVRPRGRWVAALFVFKAVSLSVGLGVAGLGVIKVGAMTWSAVVNDEPTARQQEPEPEPETAAAPARRGSVRASVPEAAIEVEPAPAIDEASTEPAPPPPRVSRSRAKAPLNDRLREEVDLLTRARAELDAGRHVAVLALVAEHERRFADGAMIEERQAWRAIATCSLGRPDARTQAESFLANHPRSSLAEKVRRACSDRLTDPGTRSD